jgi:hypothetical protein
MTPPHLKPVAPGDVALDELPDERPEIVIRTDEHHVVDEAIAALRACPDVYQRAGLLVHVIHDDGPLRGLSRGGPAPQIRPLPLPHLRELLAAHARWMAYRKRKNEEATLAPAHPPAWAVQAVAARGMWEGIRRLEAVVESPVLRPDGTVLDKPGYDPETGLLFKPAADFGRVPEQPTLADAQKARDELVDIIADFPFTGDEHRSACLAALLTPLARYAFRGPAPLFLVDANVRGAGKSLLCDVTGELATGRPMARMSHPENDEEMRKRITAIAIAGDPLVLIDNIVGCLGCASLDAALTATTWRDRILGQSATTPDLPLLACWYATGNNVAIVGDTARRTLYVRLDSDQERPEEREGFRHPQLLAWVRAERTRLVRAALTILRAYVVAGRPAQPFKPWGSFEGWSALVRAALVWLGEPDPAMTRVELTEHADVEMAAVRALLANWSAADPDGGGITVSELLSAVSTPGPRYEKLRSAICALVPERGDKLPNAKRVGMKLHHLRRRIVDGRALNRRDSKMGAVWFVEQGGAQK